MANLPLILAIDDDADLVQIFQDIFQAAGFRFLSAANGREGIMLAEKECPDLILLDLRMPEMDGAETITEMRKRPALAGVKVVILTNFNEFGGVQIDEAFCRKIGADGFFPKERDVGELVSYAKGVIGDGR